MPFCLWMKKRGLIIAIARQHMNVHAQITSSLVMLFVDTEHWPKLDVTKEAAWDALSQTATPIMNTILEQFYPAGG